MMERGRGRIVLVGSLAGRSGGLLSGPHYVASKGAVGALVRWFARKARARHAMFW
jgi:3-oxoacyl-[acyl-carrier protein] reductase